MWSIQTLEYYSAIKKNELLTLATTWMNLENMMLSEEASHKRPHIVRFHVYKLSTMGKPIETERRFMVARAEGRGWREIGSDCSGVQCFFGR